MILKTQKIAGCIKPTIFCVYIYILLGYTEKIFFKFGLFISSFEYTLKEGT